ncbi:MAG: hypothetical protein ACRCZP_18580, partial [Phycicoccus sp.]
MAAPHAPLWPPTLGDLKRDLDIAVSDVSRDAALTDVLDAAVATVERVRGGSLNFTGDPLSLLPGPGADVALGT